MSTTAINTVDPNLVPKRTLNTGSVMPAIGLGTFGSDHITNETVAATVIDAAKVGYRHFDCASVYGNEKEIGAALKEVMDSGIPREELWITSKLWNDKHAEEDVLVSLKQSLEDLQLDYLDMYLVHWPFPNFHAKGCDVSSRSEASTAYIHENFMKTWRQMEKAVELGLVKNIGTSNVTIAKLKLILADAKIKPAATELELHPHFQQQELFDFIKASGIEPVGFSPIGSPQRPDRDKTEDDTVDTEDPVMIEIAKKHGIHPATLCVKWACQRGQTPIPFSTNPRNYYSNLLCTTTAPLSDEEMEAISKIDKNCRLIKGQVFLWKDNQDWQDLWDIDGTIAQ